MATLKRFNESTGNWEYIQLAGEDISKIKDDIGDLELLETEEKEDLVGAVNENRNELESHKEKIASGTDLGHVKIGDNLTVEADGTLNAEGGIDYTITDTDPTTDDDETQGYEVGSRWINQAEEMEYICVDSTESEAVWRGTTEDKRIAKTNIYGLRWNQSQDTYQRTEDAENLTVGASIAGEVIQSDFDNAYPWSDIRRCNLADDGTVNAYEGEPGFEYDGSNGQVMVEVPKFWVKVETDDSGSDKIFDWKIADNPVSGFSLDRAFIKDGVEKDYFYVAAFEGHESGGKLESRSGVQPSTDEDVSDGTRAGFRSLAEGRGSGWSINAFYQVSAIQLLYLIEFGDFKSQDTIGRGIVDLPIGSGNASLDSGQTENLGSGSGRASGTDGEVAVSYRGIENFWGNIWEWVDGLNINDYEWFVSDHSFEDDLFTPPYESIAIASDDSNDYVTDVASIEKSGFIPTELNGSSSTFLGDYYFSNSGERVARLGGYWRDGSQAGAFCWRVSGSASAASRLLGARLLFVPNN